MLRRTIGPATIAGLALAMAAPPAGAEPAVGVVNGANVLVTLDTAAPGTYTSAKPITGLQAGEQILGLDYRHLPNQTPPVPPSRLFGLGVIAGATDTIRLYTIDAGTGAATLVSSFSFTVTAGTAYGMDFNPTVDRIRVVNNNDENFRINPNNGARADTPTNDTDVNPAANQIVAVAYDRLSIPQPPAIAVNTTLYGISLVNSALVTVGGINQSPSPNGGAVMNALPLGVTLMAGSGASTNLDISFGGTAYMTATNNATGRPGLYTVNLGTGAATLVGSLPDPLRAFATVPATSVQLAAASASAPEGGSATVTVTRSGSLASTTTVAYATSDATANTSDYGAVSGTLTFARDEASRTITIPIAQDAVDEPDETFALTVSSPSVPTTLGAPSTATVTIVDDDAPAATPDTTAPTVTLSGVKKSMSLKAFLKGVKATIRPSEAVAVVGDLQSTVRRAQAAAFNLGLATKRLKLGAGRRSLTIKPSRRLVGHPRKTFEARLRVTATDAAGNARTLTRTISVKPG